MQFVSNANFKGDFGKKLDLHHLHKTIPNSKLCDKPNQLVVKDLKGTLIIFGNGKFRTMGCNDELDASFLAFSYADGLAASLPSITIQSYTLHANLCFHVNLVQLSAIVPCVYEPELFPALRLSEYKPVCVNIFNTGKVVVCGLKDPEDMYMIVLHLRWMCEPFCVEGSGSGSSVVRASYL